MVLQERRHQGISLCTTELRLSGRMGGNVKSRLSLDLSELNKENALDTRRPIEAKRKSSTRWWDRGARPASMSTVEAQHQVQFSVSPE